MIETLALAALAVAVGQGLRRWVPVLARYDLPAPVLGGLLVAVIVSLLRRDGQDLVRFDTTLQAPLMIAFFTTIGFGASLRLLRVGGVQVAWFLAIATVAALLQNLLGAGLAAGDGPAAAAGRAGRFGHAHRRPGDRPGVRAAVRAGRRQRRHGGGDHGRHEPASSWAACSVARWPGASSPAGACDSPARGRIPRAVAASPRNIARPTPPPPLLRTVILILLAMWVGGYLARGFTALGITLPAYIGAMLAAAVLRNIGDHQPLLHVPVQAMEDLGAVALSLFIAMALMTLKLWELVDLALPLLVLLVAQAALLVLLCQWVFRLMGRDFDAAVMAGGFYGFMMGTTANAVANMQTLTDRYGPAPRAFLVVPLVGAFFIDFVNALLITAFLNLLG